MVGLSDVWKGEGAAGAEAGARSGKGRKDGYPQKQGRGDNEGRKRDTIRDMELCELEWDIKYYLTVYIGVSSSAEFIQRALCGALPHRVIVSDALNL